APFLRVERGFYKSTASVYLGAGLITAIGFSWLAIRGTPSTQPTPGALWSAAVPWLGFSIACAIYLATLWGEGGRLRPRSYTAALVIGLVGVIANSILLKPSDFGAAAAVFYGLTALTSSLVLGLVSGAMMFGHWYLIDPNLPVEYLRSFVRVLAGALIADVAALGCALGVLAVAGGAAGAAAMGLLDSHVGLLLSRMLLGPVATLILTWMTWQTLK